MKIYQYLTITSIVFFASNQNVLHGQANNAVTVENTLQQYAMQQDKINDEYLSQQANALSNAIEQLESIAKESVKNGDAANASAAWREVLRLDNTNKNAIEFFEAFNALEEILSDLKLGKQPEAGNHPKTKSTQSAATRNAWLTPSSSPNSKPFVRFKKINGDRWVQFFYGTDKIWKCVETFRNDDYIELFDMTDKQVYRLHDSVYYQTSQAKIDWRSGENGYWQK